MTPAPKALQYVTAGAIHLEYRRRALGREQAAPPTPATGRFCRGSHAAHQENTQASDAAFRLYPVAPEVLEALQRLIAGPFVLFSQSDNST
jgi:hypothetical protein